MNFLVVFPNECSHDRCVVLEGERASFVHEHYALAKGNELSLVIRGQGRGQVVLDEISPTRIVGKYERETSNPRLLPLVAVVAVARPQTVKKVIHASVCSGIRELHFVPSEYGEKSYLQSHVLSPEAIEREVLLGMGQSGEVYGPRIVVHRTFWSFSHEVLSTWLSGVKILGSTRGTGGLASFLRATDSFIPHAYVAIGSERGWSEREEDVFMQRGFIPLSAGERIHRVENALMHFIGAITVKLALE